MTDDCRHRTDCEGSSVDPMPGRGLRLYVATQAAVSIAIITTIGLSALMLAPWLNRGP